MTAEVPELRALAKASGLRVVAEPRSKYARVPAAPFPVAVSSRPAEVTIYYPESVPIPVLTGFQKRFAFIGFPLNHEKIQGFGDVFIRMTSAFGPEPVVTPDLLTENTEVSEALFGPFEQVLKHSPSVGQQYSQEFLSWEEEAARLGFTLFPYLVSSEDGPEARIGHGYRASMLRDALSDEQSPQLKLAGLGEVSRKKLTMTLESLRKSVNGLIGFEPHKHHYF